jgi:hypothetical protein
MAAPFKALRAFKGCLKTAERGSLYMEEFSRILFGGLNHI